MGSKHIFLLTLLIVLVSCEQKNSLTFVIDDTSSMWNDIAQVKRAAKSIVDIVLNEKSSQIEDIVVVTFNDPGVSFRKRTRNQVELKKSLDDISVYGGGDCPEMALSGIKLALEESQPGSFLYVFTDASAKDYKKFDEIKALCQEKQSQIVFVVTNDCGHIDTEDYQVYYKIAAASNGQVFRVSKDEVGQVLEYVKETIKGDRTVITSTVVPPFVWSYVHFNIDDKTEYALVSASGSNVQLVVLDQHKREVRGYEIITWTKNVKVLKLIGLTPGAYQAKVFGSSDVNVMIFGRTDFNFEFGFSNEVQNSLKYTETQPIIGSETHLIISVKDDEYSVNIHNVEILDMNERVIRVLPLTNVGGNVYATDKFLPPDLMFKVAVTATVQNTGKPIRRIANTPVEPIKPVVVAPEISDSEKNIKVKEDSTVNIHCRIRKGKPKPHVTWYFKRQGAGDFSLIKDKTDEVLRVSNVVISDAGHYKCVAENIAGRASHIVQLEVEALPAFERTSTVVKARQSANIDIQCKISKGNPPPIITWQFKSSETERFYDIDNTGQYMKIFNVQLSNSGFYKCVAKNTVGTAQQTIQVIVLVPPKIYQRNMPITTAEGSTVSLSCGRIEGNPPPTIRWLFRRQGTDMNQPLEAGNGSDKINIKPIYLRDSGFYTCRVENEAGFDEHTIQVTVEAAPQLENFPNIITAKENSFVRIDCKVTKGSPTPRISWYFRAANGKEYGSLKADTNSLELIDVQVQNSGHYKCVAENNAGRVEQNVELIVEVLPEFKKTPGTITVQEKAPITIDCGLYKGNPLPKITWQFRTTGSAEFTTLRHSGEQLSLPSVQLRDSGEYHCVAVNSAGSDEKTTLVTVLAAPEIARITPSTVRAKENETISIQCRITKGFPKPTLTWWYKNATLTEYITIANNVESLHLQHLSLNDAGHYKCIAENTVGVTDQDVEVVVEAPPRIVFIPPNSPTYIGVEGDVVARLPCTAVGFPKPVLSWIVDHMVVGYDKSKALYFDDGVLYLKNPVEAHSTTKKSHSYECHAVNALGEDRRSYEVYVSKNADYDEEDQKYGEIHKPYDINCPLPYTDPKSVRWYYNSVYFNKTGPSLHFDDPTQANNGNYTCRVSDLNGAASYSVEITFGNPPSAARLMIDEEWDGEEAAITCTADQIPDGKYEWFYRDQKVKEAFAHELDIELVGWGQYVCRVTNPLGSLNITYNVHSKDCIIDRNLSKMKNLPLVLDMSSTWPRFTKRRQYQIVPQSDQFTFICQDESPKNISKSQSNSNSFTKFPNTKSIIAVCDHEDLFLVDDVPYKFSDLDCKTGVTSSFVPTQECLGKDTMMMNVGFHVNGFLDVYKSCLDTKRNIVLYTEVIVTGTDSLEYTNESEGPCQRVSDCCYESVQLVNAADVSMGPAEKATLSDSFNSVQYCRPNDANTTSWHDIEMQVRRQSSQSRMKVWSGVVNYTTVDKLLVPQYLWKVVKNLDTQEIVAIVHSNALTQLPRVCADVCQESSMFEVNGPRTYCCRLEEFKRAFNLPINF